MVVCKYDGCCVGIQRGPDDLAHRNARRVDIAALHQNTVKRLALRVEAQQIDLLLHRTVKERRQVLAALGRAGQDALRPGAADEVPPFNLRHQCNQFCRAGSNARHLHQLRYRRLKYAGERAEARDQRMRQQIRVLPRKGVVEQHLQNLNIG